MRIGRRHDCGELLSFEELRRRLDLGRPSVEGPATIALADIVGSAGRAADFDGCFQARDPRLARRIAEVGRNAMALNEPIDVIRVDRAYFVVDGHKRVSLGRADGREFIDARVSSVATPYAVTPGVESTAIDRTAREQRFREDSGLLAAVPAARFALTGAEGYAELQEAVDAYAYELSQRLGRLLSREEGAALWYECVYLPTLRAAAKTRLPTLLSACTDAELFLALHRQSRELFGTECRVAQDEADHLVKKVAASLDPDAGSSMIGKLVERARRRPPPRLLEQRRAD